MSPTERDRIARLLRPKSVALIGASDSSTFSALGFANLTQSPGVQSVHLVNPRSNEVHGTRTAPSCVAVGDAIDLAMIMVRNDLVEEALDDAAKAGATGAVILGSGFAEVGEEGRLRQEALVAAARERDITLLGPNSLGFVNVVDGMSAMTIGDPPRQAGSVALISQSGASCGAMKDFAALAGVGLAHVVTVGNEAMVTVGHLLDALVDDPSTEAVAIFMESVREPMIFREAAARARAAGKAVVILKAGRSQLAASIAASHTGALVGDDRVIDAVFSDLGIIRVDGIEEMIVTAGLAATTGRWSHSGIGVVAMSGGACDITADLAESEGVQIPELELGTREHLRTALPEFAEPRNPLDITGAAVKSPELWTDSIAAVGSDEAVGAVLAVHNLPLGDDPGTFYGQKFVDAIAEGMRRSKAPGIYVTQVSQPITGRARRALNEAGIEAVVPGMQLAVRCARRLAKWSSSTVPEESLAAACRPLSYDHTKIYSEPEARELLSAAGVPFGPWKHVRSADEAQRAAASFGVPCAVKVVSAEISHKSNVGGVRLGVPVASTGLAFDEVVAAASPYGRVDGAIVSPMKSGGVELLVGVTRDLDWGLMLTVGLGGVLVEILNDVATMPLPTDRHSVETAMRALRGWPLLDGFRGSTPVDVERLLDAVLAVAGAAVSLGEHLESLEVNPLSVDAGNVEALDALIVWREEE